MNQPVNPPVPDKLEPHDLQPAVLPGEVEDANLTANAIHQFSGSMARKMQVYQGRFDHSWFNKGWTKTELDLEIARCILQRDYVSAANYAMMANYYQCNEGAEVGQKGGSLG